MITASQDFITAVGGNGRHFDAKIYLDGSEVACDIISMTAAKGAQAGRTFTLGSVFSSSLEIICSGLSVILENEDIEVKIGILTDREEDTYSYITYGKYTVIEAQKTKYQTVLTCVGFISSKLNAMLPDVGNTPTLAQIASAISATTGVPVSFAPSVTTSTALIGPMGDISCRAALSAIAFAAGGFATENNTGGIVVYPFTVSQSTYSLLAENCLAPPIVSEEAFEMTGVKVIQNEEGYILTTDTTVVENKTYYEKTGSGTSADPYVYTEVEEPAGNPSAQGWYEIGEIEYHTSTTVRQTYENKYISQAAFNYLASVVVGIEFVPSEIDMSLGDPRLEPWDCLTVTDVDGETTYTVPCHLIESTFDGGFSSRIYSIGESLSDMEVAGSITEQVKQAISDLTATQVAASQAKAAAASAKASAQQAKETTDEINRYADSVSKTVTQILTDGETAGALAQQAIQDAGQARQSANQANLYATSALTNLGVVENVLDTLDWITKHGYYQVTADTSVVANKIYYSLTGTAIASPTGNPSLNLYYERSGSGTEADPYVYALSADTAVDNQKTYYSVTAVSIAEPTGNPSENGYYEMQMNSALSQYVSTHLSLTDAGLSLLNDNSSGSMLLSTDGVTIKNAQGITVGQYGEGATIGATTSQHISIVNGQINFWAGNESDPTNLVAYVSGQELHIPRVVVVQSLQMANWRWDATIENHLSLNWIGG